MFIKIYQNLILFVIVSNYAFSLIQGFVYLHNTDLSIVQSASYFSNGNFVGLPLDSYKEAHIISTAPAAVAVRQAQKLFNAEGYTIVVNDRYRL